MYDRPVGDVNCLSIHASEKIIDFNSGKDFFAKPSAAASADSSLTFNDFFSYSHPKCIEARRILPDTYTVKHSIQRENLLTTD